MIRTFYPLHTHVWSTPYIQKGVWNTLYAVDGHKDVTSTCVCVLTYGYVKQCTHTLSYRSSGSYLRWHRSPISLAPSAVLSRVFSRVPTKPDIVGPTTPRHRWLACSQPRYLAPPGPRRRWEAHGSMIGLGVPRVSLSYNEGVTWAAVAMRR